MSVAAAGQSGGWMARHWRGDLPLWKSYWLVGALGGVGIGIVVVIAIALLQTLGLQRGALAFGVVAVVVAMVAAVIWQMVGIWRSAGNHIVRTTFEWRRFWAVLARIAVVLTALQYVVVIMSLLAAIVVS